MEKIGVLLTNIGTPISPEPEDVGRYLSEFLMDPYVIDIPWLLRWILVKILIVPKRKYASSEAYKKIWMHEGSPLLVLSQRLAANLIGLLGAQYSVKIGMRYSEPSIQKVLTEFQEERISRLLVVPMYPQFADSSSTSSIEKVKSHKMSVEVNVLEAFYDQVGFIDSYAEVIRESLGGKQVDHYLFSYHGLPERQIRRLHADYCFKTKDCCETISAKNKSCYRAQCVQTTRLLAQALGLKQDQFSFSFQSRLGRTKWIDPYTDLVLPQLARRGVKSLAVVCPSFVADCLETIEEIGIRGRNDFIKSGGRELHLVPCLNDHLKWSQSLAEMIRIQSTIQRPQ